MSKHVFFEVMSERKGVRKAFGGGNLIFVRDQTIIMVDTYPFSQLDLRNKEFSL